MCANQYYVNTTNYHTSGWFPAISLVNMKDAKIDTALCEQERVVSK